MALRYALLGKVLVCDTRIHDRLNQGQRTVHHVQKEAYHEALCFWEAERDLAKFKNQRSGWKKTNERGVGKGRKEAQEIRG